MVKAAALLPSTSARPAIEFRFDAGPHEYVDLASGVILPHITGMLERAGLIDDTWYTEESCDRGHHVHALTAEYDLGALDVASLVSDFSGFVLAHVACMRLLRPDWKGVEEPRVHPVYKFGGRPDRWGYVRKLLTVGEVKSGGKEKSHRIQTALQVLLLDAALGTRLEPHAWQRLAFYYKANGKFSVDEHADRRDFDEARRVIRLCC